MSSTVPHDALTALQKQDFNRNFRNAIAIVDKNGFVTPVPKNREALVKLIVRKDARFLYTKEQVDEAVAKQQAEEALRIDEIMSGGVEMHEQAEENIEAAREPADPDAPSIHSLLETHLTP